DGADYRRAGSPEGNRRVRARELARGAAEKPSPPAKYKYAKDEPVTLQGWDGYALDIENADGALTMMRTYIVKDRLYRLLVTAKNDEQAQAAANRFLSSLKLAESRSSYRTEPAPNT